MDDVAQLRAEVERLTRLWRKATAMADFQHTAIEAASARINPLEAEVERLRAKIERIRAVLEEHP